MKFVGRESVLFERERPLEPLKNDVVTRTFLLRIDTLLATHFPPLSFLVHPIISGILALELDVMAYYFVYFAYKGLTTESFRKTSLLNQLVWFSVCLLPVLPVLVLFSVLVLPSIVFWYIVYFKLYVKAPEILFQANPKNISLIKRCPSLLRRLWPTPYAANTHLQTSLHQLEKTLVIPFERVTIKPEDGGLVSYDIFYPKDFKENGPTVIIFPGLTGGSHSSYVRFLTRDFRKKGIQVIGFNHRGCNQTPLQTSKFFSITTFEDEKLAIDHIHRKYPNAPLIAVGVSFSSGLLIKYLASVGSNTPIIAGISLANTFDFVNGSKFLHSSWILKNTYNWWLTKLFLKYCKNHSKVFMNEPKINYFEVIKSTTLLELDARFCAKIYDYKSTHEYYKAGSVRDDIVKVQVPVLLVNALDDPICLESSIPYVECLQNPNAILVTTKFGGHLGWYEGWFPLQKSWSYEVVLDWSQSVFDHHYAASKAIKLP